jgi:DNA-binding NtrC family response regulator
MELATVLIVDDDDNLGQGLRLTLRRNYRVLYAEGAPEALALLEREAVDLVLCDHLMPGMTGVEFLKRVAVRFPDTMRIMLTGHADTSVAIQAINEGEVFRFLTKPVETEELRHVLALAWEKLRLERENRQLRDIVRTSPELAATLEDRLQRAALRRWAGGEDEG